MTLCCTNVCLLQALSYHGSRLPVVVAEYKSLVKRMQRRVGKQNPVAQVKLHELKDYMDKKLGTCDWAVFYA